MVSIWKHTLKGDLPAILRELISTQDANAFDAAAMKYLVQDAVAQDQLKEAQAALAIQIEEMKAQGGLAASMARDMERAMSSISLDDEDDFTDDFEDLGAPDPALEATSINLAQSHMFFHDPYASLDYEVIDEQTRACIEDFASMITAIVNHPTKMADFIEDADGQFDDLWDTDVGSFFGDWHQYWETPNWTYFLTLFQEDKELPIEIDFGRMPTNGFQDLMSQLNALKAEN